MRAATATQIWISQRERRQYALAVGLGLGLAGAGLKSISPASLTGTDNAAMI